jgi:hypothetical protein
LLGEKLGQFLFFTVRIDGDDIYPRPRQLDGEKPLARAHIERWTTESTGSLDDEARGTDAVVAETTILETSCAERAQPFMSIRRGLHAAPGSSRSSSPSDILPKNSCSPTRKLGVPVSVLVMASRTSLLRA